MKNIIQRLEKLQVEIQNHAAYVQTYGHSEEDAIIMRGWGLEIQEIINEIKSQEK